MIFDKTILHQLQIKGNSRDLEPKHNQISLVNAQLNWLRLDLILLNVD